MIEQPEQIEFTGLSLEEVAARKKRGEINLAPEASSRSLAAILRENTLTLFNAILTGLLVLILAFGDLHDALFGLVLVGNTLIGIVQELRAKFALDRLSVLSATTARVFRGAGLVAVDPAEVVLDDVIELQRGDQVVADGELLQALGLEIDESLLTGESEPVEKAAGGELLSGSFAVAGSGVYRANRVGHDAYARQLTTQARRFKPVYSELRTGINRILVWVTWVMIPVGLLLFWREIDLYGFRESVSSSVAAMVGMVPEGLVLLTSIAFALAVVVLGKRNVLVQELPAVEGLARVDVICFDKTGTLTEAGLRLSRVESLTGEPAAGDGAATVPATGEVAAALGALTADPASRNATMDAIAAVYPAPESATSGRGWRVPFSSERKWSAVNHGGREWFLGAPEILLEHGCGGEGADAAARRAQALAAAGNRVLLLAQRQGNGAGEIELCELEPVALVLLEEQVRRDAAATLAYFARQGVAIKVISGDNVATVAAVAARAGAELQGDPLDGRDLPEDPEQLARAVEEHTVFGRVSAHQKQEMVKALQANGHVVVMTGDGVNDTLAVKEADIGIAVGAGAAAPTKAVAELVLLDGRFATLPDVVAEGRRIIANIERVAYLFVTKTCYATLLALVISILGWPYPFIPRHLTLVGAITIGIPAFFLALGPSRQRYRPGFVRRVLHFTVPAGALLAAGTMGSYAFTRAGGATLAESRTVATIILTGMGLSVLAMLSRPLNHWRLALLGAMVVVLVVATVTPFIRQFLALELPPWTLFAESIVVATLCVTILAVGLRLSGWRPRNA